MIIPKYERRSKISSTLLKIESRLIIAVCQILPAPRTFGIKAVVWLKISVINTRVITYTLLQDNDLVVLQKKSKQPYLNLLNLIGGKLHEGETSEQASIREVSEKTGITIDHPKLAGIFEVRINEGDILFTQVIAYVFTAIVSEADYSSTPLQAVEISTLDFITDLAPDFLPIYHRIASAAELPVGSISIQL